MEFTLAAPLHTAELALTMPDEARVNLRDAMVSTIGDPSALDPAMRVIHAAGLTRYVAANAARLGSIEDLALDDALRAVRLSIAREGLHLTDWILTGGPVDSETWGRTLDEAFTTDPVSHDLMLRTRRQLAAASDLVSVHALHGFLGPAGGVVRRAATADALLGGWLTDRTALTQVPRDLALPTSLGEVRSAINGALTQLRQPASSPTDAVGNAALGVRFIRSASFGLAALAPADEQVISIRALLRSAAASALATAEQPTPSTFRTARDTLHAAIVPLMDLEIAGQ